MFAPAHPSLYTVAPRELFAHDYGPAASSETHRQERPKGISGVELPGVDSSCLPQSRNIDGNRLDGARGRSTTFAQQEEQREEP